MQVVCFIDGRHDQAAPARATATLLQVYGDVQRSYMGEMHDRARLGVGLNLISV
jgi:hypothetical protein